MSDVDEERRPELIGEHTIELMVLAARALVVVIYVVVLITFAILALGFVLHLAGASSEASFVDWAYRNTDRAMQPFRGMFPVERLDDRSEFDPSLLFAAAMYGFFAIGLHALVNYLTGLARAHHRRAVLEAEEAERERLALARADAAARARTAHVDLTTPPGGPGRAGVQPDVDVDRGVADATDADPGTPRPISASGPGGVE